MKGLLRPLFVGGLSVAISVTTLLGSSSVALAASPLITAWPTTLTVHEGDKPTIEVTFTDPDGAGLYSYVIFWGDGDSSSGTIPAERWTFQVTKSAPYAVPGFFILQITVRDSSGAANSRFGNVTVLPNQAPTITSFAVTAGSEGGSSTLALTFADTDASDTHTVSVAWGDGATTNSGELASNVTTFDATHAYADNGTYPVVLTLLDSALNSVTAEASVSPTNVAPTAGSLTFSPASVTDHQALTVSGTFTDPGSADTFTITVDWGDGTTSTQSLAAGTSSFSAPHEYAATGTYAVTATIADDDGGSDEATSSVTVLNKPPSVVSFDVAAGTEGSSSTLSLSFADATAADWHTVSVTWGDGSTSDPVLLASGETTYSTTHVYADNGTYQVVLTLLDSALNSVTAEASVSPTNVAPTVGSLTLSPASVTEHQIVTVSGSFTDPGTDDTFTLTVDWGDGPTSTQSLAAGTSSFSAPHEYAATGTYTVTATIADDDGSTGSQTASVVVTGNSVSELLDQMAALILTFDLEPHTERWLLRRIDALKASLSTGNTEVCADLKLLGRLDAYASRKLTADEYAALGELVAKLEAAAQCPATSVRPNAHKTLVASTSTTKHDTYRSGARNLR